jgi:hypothetical protein
MGGIVLLVIGVIALLVGTIVFLTAYPDTWYAGTAKAAARVETTILSIAIGFLLVLVGTSLLAFARSVVGQGTTEHYEAEPVVEAPTSPDPFADTAEEELVDFGEIPSGPAWQEESWPEGEENWEEVRHA